jgi:hypothetical protein
VKWPQAGQYLACLSTRTVLGWIPPIKKNNSTFLFYRHKIGYIDKIKILKYILDTQLHFITSPAFSCNINRLNGVILPFFAMSVKP